jgi:hypothetical protein
LALKQPPAEHRVPLPPNRAILILKRLLGDAMALPEEPWDSPKRSQWKDTARGALEQAGVSRSLLDSFDRAQGLVFTTDATDEEMRRITNASVAEMKAVLQSTVEQLEWRVENEDSPRPSMPGAVAKRKRARPRSGSAQVGFLDSLIILLASAALVLFLLWVTSRTLGITTFETLPSWLQSFWTAIGTGTAGIGLAIVKALTRKQDAPHPNYLLLIGIVTMVMLLLIFLLPALFKKASPSSQPRKPASADCKDPSRVINLSLNNSGQTVEGPVCAQIVFNALRYGAAFGTTASNTSSPVRRASFHRLFPREELINGEQIVLMTSSWPTSRISNPSSGCCSRLKA